MILSNIRGDSTALSRGTGINGAIFSAGSLSSYGALLLSQRGDTKPDEPRFTFLPNAHIDMRDPISPPDRPRLHDDEREWMKYWREVSRRDIRLTTAAYAVTKRCTYDEAKVIVHLSTDLVKENRAELVKVLNQLCTNIAQL